MTNKKDQWGNIELPGLSDEKLLNTNWNHVAGIKRRNNDPTWQNAMKKRTDSIEWQESNAKKAKEVSQKQTWKENRAKAIERLKNDPQWQEDQRKRIEQRSQNQTWKDNKTIASRRLAQDKTWLANNTKAIRRRCAKPVVTPAGIFPSVTDAGLEYNKIRNFNNGRKWLINQLEVNPTEYYHISQEEYIILTGKDI